MPTSHMKINRRSWRLSDLYAIWRFEICELLGRVELHFYPDGSQGKAICRVHGDWEYA